MQNHYAYGVISNTGVYTDVSLSERGAKQYATRHGYKMIGRRNTDYYYVSTIAIKINGKWTAFCPIEHGEFIRE